MRGFFYKMKKGDVMETQFKLLIDILTKKYDTLSEILSITENQGMILKTMPEEREMFMGMVEEKQTRIDSISTGDDIFNKVFAETMEILKKEKNTYKTYIAEMQRLIKAIMDMEIRIRLEERNNQKRMQNAINIMPMRLAAKQYAKQKTQTVKDLVKNSNKEIKR